MIHKANRQGSWIVSQGWCRNISRKGKEGTSVGDTKEKWEVWGWIEVWLSLSLLSFSTTFSSYSSPQLCYWTTFSMVLILMQDKRDIWLCCFSSPAHRALNFHPLLMLYSFRRPPELLQVTQKHISATTEYAQCVKGRQMSKKTMFKLNTTTGLSGLFTLCFLFTPLTLQTLWKPAVLCHIIETTIQCWFLIRRLLETTN